MVRIENFDTELRCLAKSGSATENIVLYKQQYPQVRKQKKKL